MGVMLQGEAKLSDAMWNQGNRRQFWGWGCDPRFRDEGRGGSGRSWGLQETLHTI